MRFPRVLLVFSLLPILATAFQATTQTNKKNTYTPPPPPPRSEPSYTPPRSEPSYTPPRSEPSYTPPRSEPSYTPPANNNTYHPPANNNNYNNTYHPPANNNYNPPSGNTYRPPVNTYQPHTYTPGANPAANNTHTYTPGGSINTAGSTHTYTPGAAHTYTPGSTHTYTPGSNSTHTYTPGASGSHTASAPSDQGVATATGTVYTPVSHTATTHITTGNRLNNTPAGQRLDAQSSVSVIHQFNTARASMTGINKRPLPSGTVSSRANGSFSIAAAGGKQFNVRPNGTISAIRTAHERATFTTAGKLRSIHTATVDVFHAPHGVHTVVQHRPGNTMLVSTSRHSGYYERPFTHAGKPYIARTYLSRGITTTRVYRRYSLHGYALESYIPAHTYAADYYGWAYYPWDAPLAACSAGWAGQPWVAQDSGYFDLAQSCASASDWLTNYLLGNTLADADQMQADGDDSAEADDAGDTGDDPDDLYAQSDSPITPELQQAIAQQVQQQIAYENAAAQDPSQAATLADLPQALVPDHLFIVSTPLDVQTLDGQNCALSEGNVIRLVNPPDDSNPAATLIVAASRKYDCPAGVQVSLSLDQLQEMENNYRAQIDSGLYALHQQQGQNGVPAAPYPAIQPPPVPADEYPTDHPDVAGLLKSEQAVGATTEAQATKMANIQLAASTPGH